MTSKSPSSLDATASPRDRFRDIHGIGPTTERCLHDAGILTFAQLGSMSPSDIYEIVAKVKAPGVSPESIAEQDWSGQARERAQKSTLAESRPNTSPSRNRQHYEIFSIKLLLNEDNIVHHTQIDHIQSQDTIQLPGWDEHRMVEFIAQHAAIRLPSPASAPQPSPPHGPTVTIIKACAQEVHSTVPSNVICTNQNWFIHIEWELSGVLRNELTGYWLIQAHLESMGFGEEYSMPADGPARVPLSDFIQPARRIYKYNLDINIAAGTIAVGTYNLVISITWEKEAGKPVELASFFEDMLQLYA